MDWAVLSDCACQRDSTRIEAIYQALYSLWAIRLGDGENKGEGVKHPMSN